MGRYTGPVERLSRRQGVDLCLKGERRLNGKGALERRGQVPPGEHGHARRRRPSVYSEQLREKQKLKRYYGVRERQFRRYVEEASRRREGVVVGDCSSSASTTSSTGSGSPRRGRRRGSSSPTGTCSSTACAATSPRAGLSRATS
jgi:ribosomal protein S4